MESEKPVYSETGGGQIGLCWPICWQATFPFSKIRVFKNKIVLSVPPIKKTLYLKEIESFSRANTLIGQGIQIKPKRGRISYLVFWPFDADSLSAVLRGLKIKQGKPSGTFLFVSFLPIIWLVIVAIFIIGMIFSYLK